MPEEKIHNNIRRFRFEAGEMTQQALADKVGCSRQTIVLLEQGRYSPSLLLAMKIAAVFGHTVDEVFALTNR